VDAFLGDGRAVADRLLTDFGLEFVVYEEDHVCVPLLGWQLALLLGGGALALGVVTQLAA